MTPARTPTETKLSKLRDALAEDRGEAPAPDLLHADVGDQASLRELANSTRVLVSTVGPYAVHGRGVVGACAAAGTDYLDLTGEPEFVDWTYCTHHRDALESGARLVHACGFDSIPHDLGVQYTVGLLPGRRTRSSAVGSRSGSSGVAAAGEW
jgi:short subunit dehydrogenase-like uncharacterized protein